MNELKHLNSEKYVKQIMTVRGSSSNSKYKIEAIREKLRKKRDNKQNKN